MKTKIKSKKSRPNASAAQKLIARIESLFTKAPSEVTDAIKADHESLRNYLGILKDTDRPMGERRRAYKAFASLLKSHSVAEETAVYVPSKKLVGREMHIKVAEGYVEHSIADDLMKKIERTKSALEWSAHANVLAETMEHHLKEEERDLLPLIKDAASDRLRDRMLKQFLNIRVATQKVVAKGNAGALKAEL